MYVYVVVSTRPLMSRLGFSSQLDKRLHRYNARVSRRWRYGLVVYVPPARRLSGRAMVRYANGVASTLTERVDVLMALARELVLPLFIDHTLLVPPLLAHPLPDATAPPPQDTTTIQSLLDAAERSTVTHFRGHSFARDAAAAPPAPRLEPLALQSIVG